MKNLKEYVNEGLADWGDDDKLDKKISKQTTKSAIENEIKQWTINNAKNRIYKTQFIFNFNTTPITVDYEGDILFKNYTTSLTNGVFQWGKVGGIFNCSMCNSLESLEGAPKEVGGFFNCSHCTSLKTLEGAPKEVGGFFSCSHCTSLKSLKGAPEKVGWDFFCMDCTSLKSLEGAPEKVIRNFNCENCTSLKTLKGAPKEVGGHFECPGCTSLKSLEGTPEKVGGYFDCRDCGTQFTKEDVKKVSNVKGGIFVK